MAFRWPFVSRAVYDDLRHDLWEERQRTAQLTQAIVELKTAGAVYVKDAQDRLATRLAARQTDPVEQAIYEHPLAAGDPALRRGLSRYADKLRREGKLSDDEIIEAVTAWSDPDANDTEEPELV